LRENVTPAGFKRKLGSSTKIGGKSPGRAVENPDIGVKISGALVQMAAPGLLFGLSGFDLNNNHADV
jgi:hypothetical protein